MEVIFYDNLSNLVSINNYGALEQLKQSLISNIIITLVNSIIILITHFKKSFNLSFEIKKIVFLFCYTGLILNIWYLISNLLFYIISITSKKMHILGVDILQQFYFVLYNLYYISPFCITYWRFILIFFNRSVLLFENIIIAIIALIPSFVAFINCVFFSNIIYSDDTFEYKHYYSSSLFVYMDLLPQVTSSIFALILNILILIKVNIINKKSKEFISTKKSEVPLTINLMFHSICPLILLIWINMMVIFRVTHNSKGEKTIWFFIYAQFDLIYRILSPITMIIFIEAYRNGILKWFKCGNKKLFIKVSSFVPK